MFDSTVVYIVSLNYLGVRVCHAYRFRDARAFPYQCRICKRAYRAACLLERLHWSLEHRVNFQLRFLGHIRFSVRTE